MYGQLPYPQLVAPNESVQQNANGVYVSYQLYTPQPQSVAANSGAFGSELAHNQVDLVAVDSAGNLYTPTYASQDKCYLGYQTTMQHNSTYAQHHSDYTQQQHQHQQQTENGAQTYTSYVQPVAGKIVLR